MRILGSPGWHYHEFGFWDIYFRESTYENPGTVTPKVRGQYEGPSIPVSLDTWHTYEIVWTGTEAQWYIDGELKDTYSVSLNTPSRVIFDHGNGEYWIDNVSVWGEMFDNTPPGCLIAINDGEENTTSRTVTLNLSAEDPESGVSEMCFANDHTWDWSNWEPYSTTKTWTLPDCPCEKKVYVKYKNGAGLESLGYFDTINLTLTCGDGNCDGGVTMGDSLAINNHLSQGFPLDSEWSANVNCDGDITMGDALAISNHLSQGFPLDGCCDDC